MAAPTGEIGGVDMLLLADGVVLAGQEDATLSYDQTVNEVNTKTSGGWSQSLLGLKGWQIEFSGLYVDEASNPQRGFGTIVEVGPTPGPLAPIEALSETTLTVEMEELEVSNQDHAGFAITQPSIRSITLSVVVDYIDPASAPNQAFVWQTNETGSQMDIGVDYGDSRVAITGSPNIESLDTSSDAIAQLNFSVAGQGAPTVAGLTTAETALFTIFQSILVGAPSLITSVLQYRGAPAGSTNWSGDSFITSLEITSGADDVIGISGTLSGSTPLTRALVPV